MTRRSSNAGTLAAVALGVLAACGGGGPSPIAQETEGTEEPTPTEELVADYSVVYDGQDCISTLPEVIPAAPLVVEVTNDGDGSLEFIIGYYDEGYDRDDHLAFVEERRGTVMGPPSFANNVVTRFVSEDDSFVGEVNLDPNRYYVVCVVKGFTDAIVLPDLVIGDETGEIPIVEVTATEHAFELGDVDSVPPLIAGSSGGPNAAPPGGKSSAITNMEPGRYALADMAGPVWPLQVMT